MRWNPVNLLSTSKAASREWQLLTVPAKDQMRRAVPKGRPLPDEPPCRFA